MKKSTLVVMAILMVGLVAMTLLFKFYTSQFAEEIKHAKTWTTELRADLAPGTNLRLARVAGASPYVVKDPRSFGLLVEAEPAEASWRADATGLAFARAVATRAFETYGPGRPIDWIELRLRRGGIEKAPFAVERGPRGDVVPVGGRR